MPVWNYILNVAVQGILYPSLFFSGWAQANFASNLNEGLSIDRPGYLLMRCYLYCFAGTLLVDSWNERSRPFSIIMLHHVFCLIGTALFLADPYGGTMLAAGPFALEAGSCFFTAWCVDLPLRTKSELAWVPWPRGNGPVGRAVVPWAYYILFSASNACISFSASATALAVSSVAWVANSDITAIVSASARLAIVVGVAGVRQRSRSGSASAPVIFIIYSRTALFRLGACGAS